MTTKAEYNLNFQLAFFLKSFYRHLIWRFDLIDLSYLRVQTASGVKRIQACRGYPDFFLAHPVRGYCGLYLEIKAIEKEELFRQDGFLKARYKVHFLEQAVHLLLLEQEGYAVAMTFGYEGFTAAFIRYLEKGEEMGVHADWLIEVCRRERENDPGILLKMDPLLASSLVLFTPP